MDKKYTYKEYESPRINLLILDVEGVFCASEVNLDGNGDMPSEDLGDIFA